MVFVGSGHGGGGRITHDMGEGLAGIMFVVVCCLFATACHWSGGSAHQPITTISSLGMSCHWNFGGGKACHAY